MDNPRNISAILGPTNTGKTYMAIERMLTYQSGMIGFPLRLLARENYDKLREMRGAGQVALITGEEQIIPDNPRYFMCTVEAMPLDRNVEFLCVDEVQLAADPDRGHIFTDRILHARGISETMFIGSDTIAPLLRRILPGITVTSRPRFSKLTYAGYKKIIRLPQRSAVVAFSAKDVYALAEFMRRQRGGTAVVLGALSPRARNAQVGMYQAGEVDYIVATDAIGMGLNMDIDHVAFAATRKFDGRNLRRLRVSEMAQIGGRAGRHMRDGTFGTTADEGSLEKQIVERIENHEFDKVQYAYWRNSDLDFSDLKSLRQSLAVEVPRDFFLRPRGLEDEDHLNVMSAHALTRQRAKGHDAVKLLWEICQIPDYRRVDSEIHGRFLTQLYGYLTSDGGQIPDDFIAGQIRRLDKYDGDMDTLMNRIAAIRIWTYISNREDWMKNPTHWQEHTREIEDRLSDALHVELTQRFVDKRVAVLTKKLDMNAEFSAEVTDGGSVLVEGQFVGNLAGLRFRPDQEVMQNISKPIKAAAERAVMAAIPSRAEKILASLDQKEFTLARNSEILWRNRDSVAALTAGDSALRPRIKLLVEPGLDADLQQKLTAHIQHWLNGFLKEDLAAFYLPAENPSPALRGILFQLEENVGALPLARCRELTAQLQQEDRDYLQRAGIVVGRQMVFYQNLYAPRQSRLRQQLWAAFNGRNFAQQMFDGKLIVETRDPVDPGQACAAGFFKAGNICLRADKLEKLLEIAEEAFDKKSAVMPKQWQAIAPLRGDQVETLLKACGYPCRQNAGGKVLLLGARKERAENPEKRSKKQPHDSPFEGLKSLKKK